MPVDTDKIFRGLYLSPHKVSLLILIQNYLENAEISDEAKQDLALFIVNEIKVVSTCTEKSLGELKDALLELEDGDFIVQLLFTQLEDLQFLDNVFDLFYVIQGLLEESQNEDGGLGAPALLEKGSILGIFVRKIIYTFNELMFEHVSKLFDDLKSYKSEFFASPKAKSADDMDSSVEMTMDDSLAEAEETQEEQSGPFKAEMSPAEIEKFVSQRGSKLESAIGKVHRLWIQEEIDEVVRLFPNIPKAHYLSFLNTLHHKDYSGALESLHRYFDQDLNLPRAVLCLAIVHFRFGHIEEGIMAIHETVRVAQERNDHECLVHALSWLSLFAKNEENLLVHYDELLRRCIERSEQLNMHYLSSFSSIELTKHLLRNPTSHSPSQPATSTNSVHTIWENLGKSQSKNVEQSMRSLIWKGHIMSTCAWELLGNWDMALHSCQLGISVDEFPVLETAKALLQHEEQASCWPQCKKAYLLYISGDLRGAAQELLETSEQFPHLASSESPWQYTAAQILFEHFLNINDFGRAEAYNRQIGAMTADSENFLSGYSRQALLDYRMGKLNECIDKCHRLVEESMKSGHQAYTISYLLLLARCYLKSGNPDNALTHALGALAQCERYVLHTLWSEATILLAEIHLSIGNSRSAHDLVDQAATRVMTNGSVVSRANLYLVWAKCLVSEDAKKAILKLSEALKFAKLLNVKHIMTEIFYLQALLWDSLGSKKERNEAAKRMNESKASSTTQRVPVYLDAKSELLGLVL